MQTEQYYLRARYYNTILSRFLQEDVYLNDGLNLYTYCSNNPVTYQDPSGYGRQQKDYTQIPRSEWPQTAIHVESITGSPNIPTNNSGFKSWFDSLSGDQLKGLYGHQKTKDIIKDRLRGDGGMHEWNMVANAVEWKAEGLTAADIMDNGIPTEGLMFKNVFNPKTGEYISGTHTNSQAGSYAHKELDQLFRESISYSDYVDKVRIWADAHLEGGADALPGYFRRGAELPEHLQNSDEIKRLNC